MRTGIINDESFADYLATDAVSPHRLEALHPYPMLFQQLYITKEVEREKSTAALDFGRLFHCMALEGEDALNARYSTIPANAPDRPQARWVNAKKPRADVLEAEAWWVNFEYQNSGKEVASQEDIALCWRMVKAIREKPKAVAMLARGKPEVTFRHQMEHFAVQCRVDWYDGESDAGPLCVNLKSIDHMEQFDYQFHKFGYYLSDAFYSLVVAKVLGIHATQPQMVNLVVEKNPPFQCAIRVADDVSIDIGRREVMRDLTLLKKCYADNSFPGEPDEIRFVSLPERVIAKATA